MRALLLALAVACMGADGCDGKPIVAPAPRTCMELRALCASRCANADGTCYGEVLSSVPYPDQYLAWADCLGAEGDAFGCERTRAWVKGVLRVVGVTCNAGVVGTVAAKCAGECQ